MEEYQFLVGVDLNFTVSVAVVGLAVVVEGAAPPSYVVSLRGHVFCEEACAHTAGVLHVGEDIAKFGHSFPFGDDPDLQLSQC